MKTLEAIDLVRDFDGDDRLDDRLILFEHLKAKGLPHKKDELFRQSGIEKVYAAQSAVIVENPVYAPLPSGPCLVFDGGVLDTSLTKLGSHMSLQKVKPLEALHVQEALPLMAHILTKTTWRLCIHDKATESVTIVHRNNGGEHHSALDIVVEKGVHAKIMERYEYASGIINNAVEIVVKEEASLVLTRVQLGTSLSYPLSFYKVEVEERGSFDVVSLEKGADIGIARWNVVLMGEQARANVSVLQLGVKKQHLSTLISLHHDAPKTTSYQLIKQILAEEAQGTIDATVQVSHEGAGTVAHQLCRSLLLGDEAKAKVHVKPQLEIFIDDLEASHGASVGQLDEAHLFYLMSRGLSEEQAGELLKGAFIKEVIEKISVEHRDEVLRLVPEATYDE